MYSTMPCADSQRSPALGISPLSAIAALEDVEELGCEATGALLFGSTEHARGTVLVEKGRVCWASAASMRRRLTELLAHQTSPPLESSRLEDVYRFCAKERLPLGETLVARGIVSEVQLMRALRQHNAEALAVMSVERRNRPAFVPHKLQKYDARFTFSPTELLVDIGALHAPDAAAAARRELRQALESGGSGAAYLLEGHGSSPIPVGVHGREAFGAADLLALGRWAKESLDVAAAYSQGADFVLGRASGHVSAAAWRVGTILYAMVTDNAAEVACVVARRRRRAHRDEAHVEHDGDGT